MDITFEQLHLLYQQYSVYSQMKLLKCHFGIDIKETFIQAVLLKFTLEQKLSFPML